MEKTDPQLVYQLALTLIPGVGDVLAKTLVSYCGSAEAVFREKEQNLVKIPDIGSVVAKAIKTFRQFEPAEKEIKFIEKNKITLLFYTDKRYPVRLKNCNDSPILLFYKGETDLNSSRILAVVGTRKATDYGRDFTEQLIEGLASLNIIVVSGLAYGIDICAHKSALKNNLKTIGVLGHGLDKIYPGVHRSTAEKMMGQGALISEFFSGTKPDKENFPKRNRIVAGMSDAVVVIEAAKKGGALITAEIANSYNRDVFALPGKTTDVYSEGCNHLIKTNKAVLIESPDDIRYIMGWEEKTEKKKAPSQRQLFIELSDEEKNLVALLNEKGQLNIDTISLSINLPMSKVAATLLNLEFNGVLRSLPGKMYELI